MMTVVFAAAFAVGTWADNFPGEGGITDANGRFDLASTDSWGGTIPAILPVEIRLYDAAGAELDGAGYLAAEDGVAKIAIRTNLNDAPGAYRLVFRDRASGLVEERKVERK